MSVHYEAPSTKAIINTAGETRCAESNQEADPLDTLLEGIPNWQMHRYTKLHDTKMNSLRSCMNTFM